mgnify:FL=1
MTEGVTFRGVVGDKDATGDDGGVGLGGVGIPCNPKTVNIASGIT